MTIKWNKGKIIFWSIIIIMIFIPIIFILKFYIKQIIFYPSDERVKQFLIKHNQEIINVVKEREKRCGDYFASAIPILDENAKVETYEYRDEVNFKNPLISSFYKEYNQYLIISHAFNAVYRGKTKEEAVEECRKDVTSFPLERYGYISRRWSDKERPLYPRYTIKHLIYIEDASNELVHDYNVWLNNPRVYMEYEKMIELRVEKMNIFNKEFPVVINSYEDYVKSQNEDKKLLRSKMYNDIDISYRKIRKYQEESPIKNFDRRPVADSGYIFEHCLSDDMPYSVYYSKIDSNWYLYSVEGDGQYNYGCVGYHGIGERK